jgi:hypothetical protein
MENLQIGYANDSHAQQLIIELSAMATHSNDDGYAYIDGSLPYNDMIWAGNNPTLKTKSACTVLTLFFV